MAKNHPFHPMIFSFLFARNLKPAGLRRGNFPCWPIATLFLIFALQVSIPQVSFSSPRENEEGAGERLVVIEGGTEIIRPEEEEIDPLPAGGYQPGARTVIHLEKYQDSRKTVADVLQEVPGVQIIQSGDVTAPARVSIRGSRPDQVLILLDGIPLNSQTYNPALGRSENRPGVNLATLSVEQVATLEIIRGAASSLYGPDAAAGVILIRTRRPKREKISLAHTEGSGGYQEYEAGWEGPLGSVALSLHLDWRKSRGEYIFFDPLWENSTEPLSAEAEQCAPSLGGGYRLRKCNERETTSLDLTLRRGKLQRWNLGFTRSRQNGLGGVLNPRPYGREESERITLGYGDGWPLGDKNKLGWDLNMMRLDGERRDNATVSSGALENDHRETRNQGDLWYEFWLGKHQFRAGSGKTLHRLTDRYFSVRRDQTSAYAGWNGYLEKGGLEGSVRQDRFSDVPTQTTYRLGGSRFLTRRFGIKASHATGYRPPTLYELHDPGSPYGPSPANPSLTPEISTSSDGGFFLEYHRRFYGEVLYFRQVIENDIVAIADPQSPTMFRFQNVFRTETSGIEAGANLRIPAGFSLDISITERRAVILENDENDPRDNGNQIPGVPEKQGNMALSWRKKGWMNYLNLRWVSRRFIDSANSRFLKPYYLWDAGVIFPLWRGFSGSFEGKNLSNETYAEMENYPPPGRQLFLTLRWNFPPKREDAKKGL